MRKIKEIIQEGLLTELAGPTLETIKSIQLTAKTFDFGFSEQGDPFLKKMHNAAQTFAAALLENKKPCWLTLSGPPGTGKTHLARAICKLAAENVPQAERNSSPLVEPTQFLDWRRFCNDLRKGEWWRVYDVIDLWMCAIDDIGVEYDPNGLLLSKLDHILNSRLGKWTIITTNMPIQSLDVRIRSRIFRLNGIVLELPPETKDFCLRK